MGLYKLTRQRPDGNAVRGALIAYDENPLTGEQTTLETFHALENAKCLIPTGRYRIAVTLSPKFGTLMPLLVNVPGRSGIRIHGGTKPEHSHGCILITRRAEYQNLVQNLINEQNRCEPIYIDIV